MAFIEGSGDGDMNLSHHLSYSGFPAGDLIPVPERAMTKLESVLFTIISEQGDRVEHLPPAQEDWPTRYRIAFTPNSPPNALSISATIFADTDGYQGTRFEGASVSLLLGRHLGNVSLFSLSDGALRGEAWAGPERNIPLEPLAKRRWIFWRTTVGDQLAKIIETSRPAPLLRDIIERQILRGETPTTEF